MITELAGLRVDLVDDDLVEPEIGHEGIFSVRGKSRPVGVW